MRYQFVTNRLGASSGIYTISDLDFYRSGYLIVPVDEEFIFKQPIEKGKYNVYYNFETEDGEYDGERTLVFTSGTLLITDPAFLMVSKDWSYFMNDVFKNGNIGYKNIDFIKEKAIVIDNAGNDRIHISVELESI